MPWSMSYWLEAWKYPAPYWPPNHQDVITEYPSENPSNGLINGWRKPTNPSDPGPWTIQKYFVYSGDPKVFGAFSARKVMMYKDLPIDPVTLERRMPPFGFIKFKTPSHHPHAIGSIKVHMPVYLTPYNNPWGPRTHVVSPNWLHHTKPINADAERQFVSDDMREVKTQLDKARLENWLLKNPRYAERLKAKQSKDLFS